MESAGRRPADCGFGLQASDFRLKCWAMSPNAEKLGAVGLATDDLLAKTEACSLEPEAWGHACSLQLGAFC